MSKLSQPMRDALQAATDSGMLTVGAARTVAALQTRGLVNEAGLNLTDAGLSVRAELLSANQGDVNPIQGDDHLNEYFVAEQAESPVEPVPGLAELLDTPVVVANRKDVRRGLRLFRTMRRAITRKRDKRNARFKDNCLHPVNKRRVLFGGTREECGGCHKVVVV